MNFFSKVPKPIVFAVSAAVGCLLGGVVMELSRILSGESKVLLLSLFQVAVWAIFLYLGMSCGIVSVQNKLMHKPLISFSQLGKVVLGAVIGGAIAGIAAQGLYSLSWTLFPEQEILNSILARTIAWGLMGCIVAGAMTRFIANLNKAWALLGGFIGGVLGCIGFLVLLDIFGDVAGRLLGGFLLGLCVGALVGFVEVAAREVWLNVVYSPKEQTKINLGADPVSFGTGNADTVFVGETPPHATVFTLENGTILCTENGKQRAVANGDRIPMGKLSIEVCSLNTVTTPPDSRQKYGDHAIPTDSRQKYGDRAIPTDSRQKYGDHAIPTDSRQKYGDHAIPTDSRPKTSGARTLYVKDKKIPLEDGQKLYAYNTVAGSEDRTVAGEVISKKTDPTKLGIRNLSDQTWVFTMPDTGKKVAYQKGQVFEINSDIQGEIIVNFQGVTGKIVKG